jgi:hypothetical protein
VNSRSLYATKDQTRDRRDALSSNEIEFIEARDGFYQATVDEPGGPYVQYRGGSADFRRNVQHISVGNLQGNDRAAVILMDYLQPALSEDPGSGAIGRCSR